MRSLPPDGSPQSAINYGANQPWIARGSQESSAVIDKASSRLLIFLDSFCFHEQHRLESVERILHSPTKQLLNFQGFAMQIKTRPAEGNYECSHMGGKDVPDRQVL